MATIHRAAKEGDLKMVMKLAEEDPRVLKTTDANGRTALYYASFYGHEQVRRAG